MADHELASIQRALHAIARDVLEQDPGQRLRGTVEYQAIAGVGAGTVQKAFQMLERSAAATTRARGHQGRFVEFRDLGKLWALAGLPQVRALLTPPGAAEIHALAAALSAEFGRLGVPLYVQFRRGAASRLQEAASGMTLAVVSRAAAKVASAAAAAAGAQPWQARPVGAGTYYAKGSVVRLSAAGFRPGAPGTFRIGLDKESADHVRLTAAEFPEAGHRYVQCPFPSVPAEILRGTIDAGVWHRMLLLIPPGLVGLTEQPLSPAAEALTAELGTAAIVFPADARALGSVIDAVSFPRIVREQRRLLADEDGVGTGFGDAWYC